MDLSKFTPDQRKSIEYVGSHLFISAGAGTGKTATLTAKIVHMLNEKNELAFEKISDLLAITFTNLATGELKARIRKNLRADNRFEDALQVDKAWISTIHSMCSRILQDHAFELGIDPGFEVLESYEAEELLNAALEEVLTELSKSPERERFYRLFAAYPHSGGSPFASDASIDKIITKLVDAISALPKGAEGIYIGPEPLGIFHILTTVKEAYQYYIDTIFPLLGKLTAKSLEAKDQIEGFIADIDSMIQKYESDPACDITSPEVLHDVLDRLLRAKFTVGQNGKGESKELVAEHRDQFNEMKNAALIELMLALSKYDLEYLVKISQMVREVYSQLKRSLSKVDNDDLLFMLRETFEKHPRLAERYANQFKLIMIDEFQDTDLLQINLANTLSELGNNELVTVGDAQQSIYRFRGADVNQFRAYEKRLPQGAGKGTLKTNFRSHFDVIHFVNEVFGDTNVFGGNYLALQAYKTTPTEGRPEFTEDLPRLTVLLNKHTNRKGVSTADSMAHAAARVAETLKQYIDAGWKPSDMAILLRRMTNADVYVNALRTEGIEAVITGGSNFWQEPEPLALSYLARFLTNPKDDEALYFILDSGIFSLSATELANIARYKRGNKGEAKGLFAGLKRAAEKSGAPRISLAYTLLKRAINQVIYEPLTNAVKRLLVESGFMKRLSERGAEGHATAANWMKALRELEAYEVDLGLSPIECARAYSDLLATQPKASPGVLVTQQQEAVSVMTIHMSKGLEFPIVVLADISHEFSPSYQFIKENVGDEAFVALGFGKNVPDGSKKLAKEYIELADEDRHVTQEDLQGSYDSLAEFYRDLALYHSQEEKAELQRLFYVGATRAEEALILDLRTVWYTSRKQFEKDIVNHDVQRLFKEEEFPEESGLFDIGAQLLLKFVRTNLVNVEGEVVREDEPDYRLPEQSVKSSPEFVPVVGDVIVPQWNMVTSDSIAFSYSSIAPELPVSEEEEPPEYEPETIGEDATALGCAFHRAAEYYALTNQHGSANSAHIMDSKLSMLSRQYDLSSRQDERLRDAFDTWKTSHIADEAFAYEHIGAEVPFYLKYADSEKNGPVYMRGEIDLLCTNSANNTAFIVDYKTGGTATETADELQNKHRLQALCYADAIFSQGIENVNLAFVRVEQLTDEGQPQVVRYSFDAQQRDEIRQEIVRISKDFTFA